jgi:hypothetical protein
VLEPLYPALYQLNTRVWLTDLSRALGRPATLDDVPDAELDRLAQLGFDWVWLLSVWRTGDVGQRISRENSRGGHRRLRLRGDGYTVSPARGGDTALARLRARLRSRGLYLDLPAFGYHAFEVTA